MARYKGGENIGVLPPDTDFHRCSFGYPCGVYRGGFLWKNVLVIRKMLVRLWGQKQSTMEHNLNKNSNGCKNTHVMRWLTFKEQQPEDGQEIELQYLYGSTKV